MAREDLNEAAFPKLSEEQRDMLARCGGAQLGRYKDGEKLIEAGERDFKFFVIRSGEVEIVDDGEIPRSLAVLRSGEFTGDIGHLTGGASLITAIARGDCEAYEVSSEGVRELMNRFPDVGDVILQAFIARRQLLRESANFTGLRLIGSRFSRDTQRIRDFLSKNRVPFTWVDLEQGQEVKQILEQFGVTEDDTPLVHTGRKMFLRNPSNEKLAEVLGFRKRLEQTVYDLVVIGAGPAGLGAAVYAASDGFSTVVVEHVGPGGQAGRSMRIENYPGVPIGVTGADLAERAVAQAGKFGALLQVGAPVNGLTFDNGYSVVHLSGGESVISKCVLIATGADYRRLEAEGCERFEGVGVFYAATLSEAPLCRGSDVVVVGGGNSAGQAAVFLAGIAHKVRVVIRGDDLNKDMSKYLVRRIEQTPNIEVIRNTVIRRMTGDQQLRQIEFINSKTGEVRTMATPALFSFIGAVPRTDWLPPEIATDHKRFILTGSAGAQSPMQAAGRKPLFLETSRPGVFAAGDVRSGSIKRVASAVGEGAMAARLVADYLSRT